MRSRYGVAIEIPRDLREALSRSTPRPDPGDYLGRQLRRTSTLRRCGALSRSPATLCDEALQRIDRNQPCSPACLDRLYEGQHAPIER
jgi:2'-5' RNA ligase